LAQAQVLEQELVPAQERLLALVLVQELGLPQKLKKRCLDLR
jgi:hypothetical protein